MNLDEDALICDLAETYHIYDYRSLPLNLVATLSAGLRDNSRIKMLAAGSPASPETILLAAIADRVEMFRYGFSKDAENGRNKPTSILETMFGTGKQSEIMSFSSPQELEAALARIRGE